MNHGGAACATLVTTLLALIGILTAAAASASPSLHDQTPVSAITLPAGQAAGPHKLILADASRPRASSYDQRATGVCLADGVNVTGGTAHFLRPQTGGRSHAYDLVGNNASAPLSQPSPAVASDGRELIGWRSVDEEASSAVALVVAAEGATDLSTLDRTGSALKNDLYHRAPSWVADQPGKSVFSITGGDGVTRTLYQLPGGVNDQPGVFEWIVETTDNGSIVVHERFIPGGSVTGYPNQLP